MNFYKKDMRCVIPPFEKGWAGWIENIGGRYASYNKSLTQLSGNLRQHMTDAERSFWSKMRGEKLKRLLVTNY